MIKTEDVSLSVVMPAYNERENIIFAVEQTMLAFKDFPRSEMIVIDDGSNDSSDPKLSYLSCKFSNLLIIKHKKNKGLACSLKDGFNKASNDYIIFNSADLPLNPNDIKIIFEDRLPFDLLVIERDKYAGATLWRKFVSVCNRILIRIFFPMAVIDIKDMNFTIIFKKDILKKIFPQSKSPGFVLAEMILKAKYIKYNVKTFTAKYHARQKGVVHFGTVSDLFFSYLDILVFRIKNFPYFKY